jgi:ferrochelatase
MSTATMTPQPPPQALPNRRDVSSGFAMARNGPATADVGILLLNMGGPDQIATVRPFLDNLFGDREIIRLPGGWLGQQVLSRIIVRSRLAEVIKNYESIGGGSPIVCWTTAQMEGLQACLTERFDTPPKVGMAMRYWHPFADEALRELAAAGTLYPHYTKATTGSSETDLLAARDRLGLDMSISFVSEWYDHDGYLDLWTSLVARTLDGLDDDVRARARLLVSAHGLPKRFVDRGDPYVEHVKATLHHVLDRLDDPPPAHLAFQSRTGPVEWIGPGTEEVIQRLAAQGHDALVVWPISFVSDHIETTYEVGQLFRDEAENAGIREYHVVPSFNDDPRLASVLADLAVRHLENGGRPGT